MLTRLMLIAALALPLAGCLSYTESAKPAPVIVQQPPSGSVVVPPSQ